MAIIEICNSTYEHREISSLTEKKYFKHRFKNKIICEECLNAYLDEASKTLTWEIFNCIKSVNTSVNITDNLENSTMNRMPSFSYSYERELLSKFMQTILPTKYEIDISLMHLVNKIYNNPVTTTLETESIASISKCNALNPITVIDIARVKIAPIVNESPFMTFALSLSIRDSDNEESIATYIKGYIMSFVRAFFTEVPSSIIQKLMNDKNSGSFTSSATSTNCSGCSTCGKDITYEKYSYNNQNYCLDCMYDIVVKAAISNNVSIWLG